MAYGYDDELPAGFQDADFEMREMEEAGRAIAAARKAGRCAHQGAVGYRVPAVYPEQEGLKPGELRCTDGCGAVFGSDQEWFDAMREVIG